MSPESLRISVLSKLSHKPSNARHSEKVIQPAQFECHHLPCSVSKLLQALQVRFQGRMRIKWVCFGFASSYSTLVNSGCFLKCPRYINFTSFSVLTENLLLNPGGTSIVQSHLVMLRSALLTHQTNTQEGQPNHPSVVSLNYLQIHEAVKAARPGLMLSSVTCWIFSQQGSGSINRYYQLIRFIETPGKGLALGTLLWLIFCQVTLAPKKSNANKVIAP